MRYHNHLLRHITDWLPFKRNPSFGDVPNGNYTEIETDGTIVMHGDAVVWDDLRFPADNLAGVGSPILTSYKGGQVLPLTTTTNQGVYINAQIPHTYKEGSSIEPHVHIVLPTAGAGAGVENLKFDFTYSWANIDGTFPTETTVSTTVDVQNYSADQHYYIDIADISGTGKEMSSMLICSLTRDVSVTNDYGYSIYLLEVDLHYQKDTIGSREESSK